MLKIVYPICCGMDVHKSFLVACIASTNECGVTTYKSRRFSTFTKDLRLCADWLSANNCKDVCMESTGKYWIPIYNILEASCKIVLAHPKYVKAIRGKKTDKKDAKWIADIFKHDLVSGSFIPPADIRQLRDLVRYRWKLNNFIVGEKNRAQNCLPVVPMYPNNVSVVTGSPTLTSGFELKCIYKCLIYAPVVIAVVLGLLEFIQTLFPKSACFS